MGKHFYVNEMLAEHPNCMAKDRSNYLPNPLHDKLGNMLVLSIFLYHFHSFKCISYIGSSTGLSSSRIKPILIISINCLGNMGGWVCRSARIP